MFNALFSFRSFLYLLYAVALTALLLYVRFPTEKFKSYCEYRVEQVVKNGKCSIAKIGYHFPASIELSKVRITKTVDDKQSSILFDRLKISTGVKDFRPFWNIDGDFYGGMFQAEANVDFKKKSLYLGNIVIENVDLAAVTANIASFDREISSTVSFTGEYKTTFSKLLAGNGSGNLRFIDGTVGLVQKILMLDSIEFEEIDILCKYENKTFQITDGKMLGFQLDADFAGALQGPLLPPKGALDITGFLVPNEAYLTEQPQVARIVDRLMKRYKKSAVPFRVGGTLNKPTFRLSL